MLLTFHKWSENWLRALRLVVSLGLSLGPSENLGLGLIWSGSSAALLPRFLKGSENGLRALRLVVSLGLSLWAK